MSSLSTNLHQPVFPCHSCKTNMLADSVKNSNYEFPCPECSPTPKEQKQWDKWNQWCEKQKQLSIQRGEWFESRN